LRTAQLAFHPIDAATAPRYDVASIDTKADDLTAVQPTTLMTASPVPFQSLTLVGQFEFLFASGPAVTMPLVELTSPGQTPIPTMIQTVFTTGNLPAGAAAMTLQPPPGFREWEGVVVAVPTASLAGLMPGSSLGLQVTFANGVVRTLPAAITLM
ncbi:MAG: hypothetical protein KDB53_16970, partial [Planctomycetes bacterium]|nr:hypothetical protein [Planctomycetota bacterium]